MAELNQVGIAHFLERQDPCVTRISYDRFDPRKSLLLTTLTEDALCSLKPAIADSLELWQGEVYINGPHIISSPLKVQMMGAYPSVLRNAVRFMISPMTGHRDAATYLKAIEAFQAGVAMRDIHERVKPDEDDFFAIVLPHSLTFHAGEVGSAEFDVDQQYQVPVNVWVPPTSEELFANRHEVYRPKGSTKPPQYYYDFTAELRALGFDDKGNLHRKNILTCRLTDQ